MRPEVMTLFRQVADLPVGERADHYARQQVPDALRQEVESLLKFDWTDDPLRDEIASAERALLEEQPSVATGPTHHRPVSVPSRIGRFEVDRLIGRGGMGEVYLARDPVIDRPVAIKLIGNTAENETARRRLVREARTAGRLRHPNIVTIFEAGEHEEQPYIAMEFVPGETLRSLIARREPLTLRRRLEMMEGACAGLAHAHRSGVVHLDIKPDNLMVDDTGVVKVLDFGISRSVNAETLTVHVAGTLRYMSPEQIQGRTIDHRSDTFSLGCALFELIAYQPAFTGSTSEIVTHIAHGPVPSLAERDPAVDPRLDQIVSRAMSLDAADRYADLDELREQIASVRHTIDPEADVPVAPTPREPTDRPSSSRDPRLSSTPTSRPRLGWFPAIATALGAIVIVGAVLSYRGNTSAPPPAAPEAGAPAGAADRPAPAAATPVLPAAPSDDIWRFLARGDRAAVLARIEGAAGNAATDPVLARSVVDTVRATAVRAREAAAAGASTSTYRSAEDQLARANRLSANGRMAESLRAFWQAADLFAKTSPAPAAAAPSAVPPGPQTPATVSAAPAVANPPLETVAAAPSQGSPAPVTPAPAPAPPPERPVATAPAPPPDNQAIVDTLRRYDAAYRALDIAALLRVFPSLGRQQVDQLRRTFEGMASYEMDTRAGRVDIAGDTATVRATVTRRLTPRVGAPFASEDATEFRLRRAGNGWVIESVAAR
jgi:eukaryotic-like serine/threonine-protein kinase